MGQAAVDLPDPLAKSDSSAPSADDLLSQLAGEEIDRLLAEADAGPAASAGAVESATQATAAQGEVKQSPIQSGQASSLGTSSTTTDQAEIDRLLSAADAPEQSLPAPNETETTSAERSALEGVSEALDAQARAEISAPQQFADEDASLPVYLKPLQWINAPMALFPTVVREAIGKVALLTLFNAIAVIVYVLIFRHH